MLFEVTHKGLSLINMGFVHGDYIDIRFLSQVEKIEQSASNIEKLSQFTRLQQ
jgi:hypothetical protein